MTKQVSVEDLERRTKQFFDLHWSAEKCDAVAPIWDCRSWQFRGPIGETKNLDGCYALLVEGNVVYIGVGAGRNTNNPGAGLMNRLSSYIKEVDPRDSSQTKQWEPKDQRKERRVDEIRMIGMPRGFGYLAYALEIFLISKLEPERNKQGRNSSKRSTKSRETKPN